MQQTSPKSLRSQIYSPKCYDKMLDLVTNSRRMNFYGRLVWLLRLIFFLRHVNRVLWCLLYIERWGHDMHNITLIFIVAIFL